MALLNSYQLTLLDHFSNGDFAHLGTIEKPDDLAETIGNSGNLLLPCLLAEMSDIDNISVGINRVRSMGNQLLDLADEMEESLVDIIAIELERREENSRAEVEHVMNATS